MTENTDRDTWAAVARWVVAIGIVAFSVGMELDSTWPGAIITGALAGAVFWLLKIKATQQRQRQTDAAELRASIGAVGKERER
jgi:hypothetical protein